eukprot:g53513.t1
MIAFITVPRDTKVLSWPGALSVECPCPPCSALLLLLAAAWPRLALETPVARHGATAVPNLLQLWRARTQRGGVSQACA